MSSRTWIAGLKILLVAIGVLALLPSYLWVIGVAVRPDDTRAIVGIFFALFSFWGAVMFSI